MTLREKYLDELVALFRAATDFPASVERSLSAAFERDEGPVLVVHRGGEAPEYDLSGAATRTLEIRLSVITRGAVPERDADSIMAVAHPLIMTFVSQNMIGVHETRTDEPRFAQADGQACMVTSHYAFTYQTAPYSISE